MPRNPFLTKENRMTIEQLRCLAAQHLPQAHYWETDTDEALEGECTMWGRDDCTLLLDLDPARSEAEAARFLQQVAAAVARLQNLRTEIAQTLAAECSGSLNEAAADIGRDADGLSAWERLPPLKTPADFGIEEDGYAYGTPPAQAGFYTQSLRKQAMARKRDLRPRYRPKPRLRSRR